MRILLIDDSGWREWIVNKRMGDAVAAVLGNYCLPSSTGLSAQENEPILNWKREAEFRQQRIDELSQHFEKAQASWLSHTENLGKEIERLQQDNDILRKKRDFAEMQNEKSAQEVIRLWKEKRGGSPAQFPYAVTCTENSVTVKLGQ